MSGTAACMAAVLLYGTFAVAVGKFLGRQRGK